ncbi:MAG: ribonuclease R [Caldithrix sp.]|nr:ribonuclease R [Caldithrix sp.]
MAKPKKISKSMQKAILAMLKKQPGVPVNRKEMSHALGIHKNNYHLFMNSLLDLVRQGQLIHVKKFHYAFPEKRKKLVGELRTTRSGYGFVDIEGQDLEAFIAQPNLNTAFDRDIVEVQLYAASKGKRLEGFVKRVVKRFRENIVGTFHKTKFYSYVTPDDPKVYRDILVAEDATDQAGNGQKVLVRFDRWEGDRHNPEGTIVEVLGDADDPGIDIVSIAYAYNLPVSFPKKIDQAAEAIREDISKEDLAGRMDLRSLTCFTIDPVDARDYDDAVSLESLPNGHQRLGVHIADVSHYVPEGTAIDKEAFKRGTSIYLADRVIPMLPEHLSNQLCSLKPGEDRLAFSCFMDFDEQDKVVDYTITPSVIHSKRRYNYEEVQEIIDGKRKDDLKPHLTAMHQLSKRLTAKRFEKGGIDFETPEVRFEFDQKGFPVKIIPRQRLDSHRLIEEFMLAANQTVAKHIKNISPKKTSTLPFIYRVHEKPDEEKMTRLFDFLRAMQVPFRTPKRVTSRFIQQLLQSIKGTKEEIVIEEVALRSMMRAVYSEENIGHFGLGFDDYTHFTSPIRRYPDLTVHRLLKHYQKTANRIPGKMQSTLKKIAEQSSRMERLAMEAERESVKLKKVEYIQQYIGETYEGVVSGVTSFGLFVELEKTFIEGRISLANLTDDFYIYDEKTYSLIGRDTDGVIRLGDAVKVRVDSVDLEKRQVDFTFLENHSDDTNRNPWKTRNQSPSRKSKRKRRKKRP